VPFHRVIEGFMAQTGDGQYGNGTGISQYWPLQAELSDVPFKRGIVGMARTYDPNSADPNAANCQFFIMSADAAFLNGQYTVVGEVVSGMDVVDKLRRGDPPSNPDKIVRAGVAADMPSGIFSPLPARVSSIDPAPAPSPAGPVSSGPAPLSPIAGAITGKRVALVIGNSSYINVPRLANPANDAKLAADTLRSLGFTLVGEGAQLNLDKAGVDRAVQSFGVALRGADVGLFYYAGHGVQVRGANYLVPVDANPTREADVDFQMLDANLVLHQMTDAGTKLNLVILDACRNNPFLSRGLRATSGGLAEMKAPEGTLIAFATQPDSVAQDGGDGNSPYTKALTQIIRKPGIDIFRTFNEVGLIVSQGTGRAQQPWFSTSPITGEFYFAGK
jgi:cyclophilin family peptidyl-prolyl cis-trans isomerase